MKLERAWPIERIEKPIENVKKVDARVWPKSITNVVDQTVERSLSQLLKESFPEVENTVEDSVEDPLPPQPIVKTGKVFVKDPMTNVWVAFAILAIMTFAAINSLYQKISSLESWLHGRMMSRH